ncbi:nitrogen fixation protein NifZ [Marichromatium gracile]|uniref:Nitrogen fixation protein NifZ n=1 Tax=Marichromatium gracile TaxID=1048 RepID=A0ABR5VGL8_MARGR|nr:nitrogen fixation protein NifZ [Marichromatium gracile]KXX63542.1 nitrogen fixation protein NifZ [Marichromatium gracile]
MRPNFEFGDAVRVTRNLRNDGTFPEGARGDLLVRRGAVGHVRDVGTFLQDQIIYAVHFIEEGRVVGCREEELQAADAPWTPSRFESRERVAAARRLALRGEVLVEPGEVGEVLRVERDHPQGVCYQVLFAGRTPLLVPESALDQPEDQPEPQEAG